MRRLRCDRATVCIDPVRMDASLVESGSRTYFNERSWRVSEFSTRKGHAAEQNIPRRTH